MKQLAERWGVSRQAIYDRIARGTLATRQIGHLLVITLDQVERVEREQQEAGVAN